jgi:hypothetical protein
MPVNNLAGLGENHFQDVRLVCDRFGRWLQHAARLSSLLCAGLLRSAWLRATMVGLATATIVSLATAITADRVSELARSASGGNPQTSCNDSTSDPPG